MRSATPGESSTDPPYFYKRFALYVPSIWFASFFCFFLSFLLFYHLAIVRHPSPACVRTSSLLSRTFTLVLFDSCPRTLRGHDGRTLCETDDSGEPGECEPRVFVLSSTRVPLASGLNAVNRREGCPRRFNARDMLTRNRFRKLWNGHSGSCDAVLAASAGR